MAKEIERRFLVSDDGWRGGPAGSRYRQGYLAAGPACTVRVRLAGERAWLTLKGPTRGGVRDEYEYPVPPGDAREMLEGLCLLGRVDKVRHLVAHGGRTWEVDEFLGPNAPLVMAEIELDDPDEPVDLPPWVGLEVTDDPRYTNAALARRPYGSWDGTEGGPGTNR